MDYKKFVVLIFIFLLSGCITENKTKTNLQNPAFASEEKLLDQQFNLAGVNAKLLSEGQEIVVEYEPKNVEYEDQILVEWGKIFGIMAKTYPNAKSYKIIQIYNGQKLATLTAKAQDVDEFLNNKIDSKELAKRLELKVID